MEPHQRKPSWLRVKLPSGGNPIIAQQKRLHTHLTTVCEEARCPNMGECWNAGTATFMLMGDTCTRGCRFCSVKTAKHPPALDKQEPENLARTIKALKLKYVVLTTVDRDDLEDQGAGHICRCIDIIKESVPDILVEALVPDFQGNPDLIGRIVNSRADVVGHNVECVRRLTAKVRDPRASYNQSLEVLRLFKSLKPSLYTKSSLMVGLGETDTEILASLSDIRRTGANFCTLGQYLQPDKTKLEVVEYIHPDKFKWYEKKGLEMGFEYVASGPMVRSSYQAGEHYLQAKLKKEKGH